MKNMLIKPESNIITTFKKKVQNQSFQDIKEECKDEFIFTFFTSISPEITYNVYFNKKYYC